jgi:hypothetical protein
MPAGHIVPDRGPCRPRADLDPPRLVSRLFKGSHLQRYLGTSSDAGAHPRPSLPDAVASDTVLINEESQIQDIQLPACALSLSWSIGMRIMFALGQGRNDSQGSYQNR